MMMVASLLLFLQGPFARKAGPGAKTSIRRDCLRSQP
jgi:hypothetical protein